MDFDYKKYSLEQLENWMHDAMSAGEATPQEIYDVIKGVVEENYHHHKHHTSQAYELLALLNGNGKGHIKAYDDVMREKEYYEPSMPPWGHSDIEYQIHNKQSCDRDDQSPECKKSWNDFWEDVDSDVKNNIQENGYDWTPIPSKDVPYPIYVNKGGGMWAPDYVVKKEDKVVKWVLPVNVDGLTGDCYVNLPDDLLERTGLKEGDVVEWNDRGDGSFEMRKVNGSK